MIVLYEIALTSNYKIKWSDSFCYMEKQEWWFVITVSIKNNQKSKNDVQFMCLKALREPTGLTVVWGQYLKIEEARS